MSNSKNRTEFRRVWLCGWIPLGICSYLVLQGAILPPEQIPAFLIELNDKVVHAVEFFILFLAAANAFNRSPSLADRRPDSWALLYCAVTAGISEILQLMAPGRMFEALDLAADGSGILAGWMTALTLKPFLHRSPV